MTKYRLKDQELQKHLDAISDGAFSECLKDDLYFFEDGVTRINFGKEFGYATRFSVLILKDELEALPEYSPNDWNVYPDVTPPEGVMMRCIIKTPGRNLDGPEPELPKICARTSGVWDGRRWQFFGYGSLCEGSTVEYRTWE